MHQFDHKRIRVIKPTDQNKANYSDINAVYSTASWFITMCKFKLSSDFIG